MSWAAEPDKELLSLRRCKLTLEAALANEQSEVIKWKLQLDEERAAHSNDIRIVGGLLSYCLARGSGSGEGGADLLFVWCCSGRRRRRGR